MWKAYHIEMFRADVLAIERPSLALLELREKSSGINVFP
jgi:hypothetical protein